MKTRTAKWIANVAAAGLIVWWLASSVPVDVDQAEHLPTTPTPAVTVIEHTTPLPELEHIFWPLDTVPAAPALEPVQVIFLAERTSQQPPEPAAHDGLLGMSAHFGACGTWQPLAMEEPQQAASEGLEQAAASCGQQGSRWGQLREPVGSPAQTQPEPEPSYEDDYEDDYYYGRRRLFGRRGR